MWKAMMVKLNEYIFQLNIKNYLKKYNGIWKKVSDSMEEE